MTIPNIDTLKEHLAQAKRDLGSNDAKSADDLAEQLSDVARMEGALVAWHTYDRVSGDETLNDRGVQAVQLACLATMTRMLLNGADDTWSGRTNDVRRARYDGICKAVEEIYYDILRMTDGD